MKGRWLIRTAAFAVLLFAGTVVATSADETSDQQSTDSDFAFGYQQVVAKAKALADKSYESRDKVPKFLQDLDAGELDRIKFNPAKALWRSDQIPYEIRFYHPGSFYVYAVKMNVVTADGVEQVPFSTADFKYPNDKLKDKVPSDLGFAGVKILHHLNSEDHLDEVVSFFGASHFRPSPATARYGLWARGLAIDTASNGRQEFPASTEFWLVQPQTDDETLTVYALLDSPS